METVIASERSSHPDAVAAMEAWTAPVSGEVRELLESVRERMRRLGGRSLVRDRRSARILRDGRIGIGVCEDVRAVEVARPDDAMSFLCLLDVDARPQVRLRGVRPLGSARSPEKTGAAAGDGSGRCTLLRAYAAINVATSLQSLTPFELTARTCTV
jgi:hypothetical protein